MARNALRALDDLDLPGADRPVSISETANEHAPGGGRASNFAHAGRAVVKTTFGLGVAADAPLGTPVEPEMPSLNGMPNRGTEP